MKLFYSPNSPYARKCRVAAIEKGVIGRIELIEVSPADNPPELWAINPLGTVPTMTTEGGMHLCESPVICKYIDSLSPEPSLMADDLCVQAFIALSDGIMDAAVACVMEKRRPADKQYDAWDSTQRSRCEPRYCQICGHTNAKFTIVTGHHRPWLRTELCQLPHATYRLARRAPAACCVV